ncbi:MAG: glycosyl transferase family protein [Pseudooceanicola sp.]|nr:glycosyl transferase family protein [Pseudooceanicola sp.]
MTLATHVRTLGRGPGRSRSLTREEAADAMRLMLDGAAPEAIGALLMLLRMKGETAEEIAGLAGAAQATATAPQADLDWPSYAAGRTRGLPWFLLSARLVALAGHSVLIHGWNGSDTAIRDNLSAVGIPVLAPGAPLHGIGYLPLEQAHPALFALLNLRAKLGLRSCINTVCRMLNPGRAAASVQGVFHPSYRELQADAAALLGWSALTVIKGGGGEVERHPGKDTEWFGLRNGAPGQGVYPAYTRMQNRLSDLPGDITPAALWSGEAQDALAEAIVIATAAVALDTLGHPNPEALAQDLWDRRHRRLAA